MWYRLWVIYTEEREFTVRLVLRAQFPEDYTGDQDGYEWAKEVPELASDLVHAVVGVLGRRPGWRLHGGNRGRSSAEEVTLVLERSLPPSP